MTSCAYLYTCPFWISVELYLRGRSMSIKQSGVFPRENKTKVNYNEQDYLNNSEDSRVADSQVTKPCAHVMYVQCASWCHYHDNYLVTTILRQYLEGRTQNLNLVRTKGDLYSSEITEGFKYKYNLRAFLKKTQEIKEKRTVGKIEGNI